MWGYGRTWKNWSPEHQIRSSEPVVMLKSSVRCWCPSAGTWCIGFRWPRVEKNTGETLTGQMLTPASWWYPSNGQTVVTVPHFQVGRVVTSIFFLHPQKLTAQWKTNHLNPVESMYLLLCTKVSNMCWFSIQPCGVLGGFFVSSSNLLHSLKLNQKLRWVFSFAGCRDLRCQQFIHLCLLGILQNWWFSKFSKGILPQIPFRFRGLGITVICQDRWDVVEDFLIAELDWTVE